MPSGVEPHGSGNLAVLKGVPVLIVEDSWHVAKALKLSLEELEMRVIGPTGTVAQARQFAVTQKPRLAVVDVNLEDGIATDFIAELYRRGVQVIVVTGYEFPPILADKTAAFIQKPYSGRQLIAAMCEILDPPPAKGEGP
jgi:DNA-binding response OmpR family regulator